MVRMTRVDVADWKNFWTFNDQDTRTWFSPGKMGSVGWSDCKGDLWSAWCWRLAISRKPPPINLLVKGFRWLSTRQASCSNIASSELKHELLVVQQLTLIYFLLTLVGYSQRACQKCQVDLWVCMKKAAQDPLSAVVRMAHERVCMPEGSTASGGWH
jgi:hypothetical protein